MINPFSCRVSSFCLARGGDKKAYFCYYEPLGIIGHFKQPLLNKYLYMSSRSMTKRPDRVLCSKFTAPGGSILSLVRGDHQYHHVHHPFRVPPLKQVTSSEPNTTHRLISTLCTVHSHLLRMDKHHHTTSSPRKASIVNFSTQFSPCWPWVNNQMILGSPGYSKNFHESPGRRIQNFE